MLVIFAGPNGSGKSTITNANMSVHGFPALYINADEIAKELGIGAYEAAVEATKRRREALDNELSFSMETVMSTSDKIGLMKEAKDKGYHVHLEYVTTQSPKINVRRVANRVLEGGHDVPEDKTLSRYDRSMKLLVEAMQVVDSAIVYNNSFTDPIIIAEKTPADGIVIYPRQPPSRWNEREILRLLGIESAKVVLPEPLAGNTGGFAPRV